MRIQRNIQSPVAATALVTFAAAYLVFVFWNFRSQPFSSWGAGAAFPLAMISLMVAFWDATNMQLARPAGLVAIALAVLASAFSGDSAAANLERHYTAAKIVDYTLFPLYAGMVLWHGWRWVKRSRESREELSPTVDKMFLQITVVVWEW